jgi:hypothetical protein
MGVTYLKADDELTAMIANMMGDHHADLADAGVTVGCLIAERKDKDGKKDGPALLLHGYPCYAMVEICSLKKRAAGMPDALITVDGNRWGGIPETSRAAIIDHELTHLELVGGEKPDDSLGRPRLFTRLHDHQFGWFDAVAKRHGDASIEIKQGKQFADQCGQLYFGWAKPPERHVESLPAKTPAHAGEWAKGK